VAEGSSGGKFWECEVVGKTLNTRWGREGSDGQSKTHKYPSEEKAQKEAEKLIRQKTKKGYE